MSAHSKVFYASIQNPASSSEQIVSDFVAKKRLCESKRYCWLHGKKSQEFFLHLIAIKLEMADCDDRSLFTVMKEPCHCEH